MQALKSTSQTLRIPHQRGGPACLTSDELPEICLAAVKLGVQSPRTGSRHPVNVSSHHTEMAPLPATSWPPPAPAASPIAAFIWTPVPHTQAIGLSLGGGLGSPLPALSWKVSPFLPAFFLRWVLPMGLYFWSLRRSIVH